MKKLKIMILLLLSGIYINVEANEIKKEYIKKVLDFYQYRLPIYYEEEEQTLIGIFSPNENDIIFEYKIEEKENFKRNKQMILSEKIKKKFKREKLYKNSWKCNIIYKDKNIIKEGVELVFRYYIFGGFYEQIKINEEGCFRRQ